MTKKIDWRGTAGTLAMAAILAGCSPDDSTSSGSPSPVPVDSNSPPVISGAPSTSLTVGTPWSFQPSASDPDGDPLHFSASGLPAWANINARTGLVSGTPDSAASGTTARITITVSDGEEQASLGPFQITVASTPTTPPVVTNGTATLQWTPPVEYADGTALPASQLSGYRIYHGTSPDELEAVHQTPSPDATVYTLDGLGRGTHYFAVTAVTVEGVESRLSNVGTKTIM